MITVLMLLGFLFIQFGHALICLTCTYFGMCVFSFFLLGKSCCILGVYIAMSDIFSQTC